MEWDNSPWPAWHSKLTAASLPLPSYLCQLTTTKWLQDNSTWPTHQGENLPRATKGRAGQGGEQAGGDRAQSGKLWPDAPYTATAATPSSEPKKLEMVRMAAGGGAVGRQWLPGVSHFYTPHCCHSTLCPSVHSPIWFSLWLPTVIFFPQQVGHVQLSCSDLAVVSWQEWFGGGKLAIVTR